MKQYEVKNISDSVKDVDTTSRKVVVAVSQTGTKDLDNDVIDPNAYTKTVSERGPKGANLIWHLTDHNASLKSAVGKPSEIFMKDGYLNYVTTIPNTSWGNDVLEFYKSGHINQHSIGFRTIQSVKQKDNGDEYNLIKELFLYEGSAVLWGANPNTPTVSVGKSIEEQQDEVKKLNEELNLLSKSLKDGRFTDEGFELIELRFKQVQEKISELFQVITLAAKEAPKPKDEKAELVKAIQLLTIENIKL